MSTSAPARVDPSVKARSEPSVQERVEALLSEYVDRPTAATALKIASRTWLRTEPEALVPAQLLGLTHGLAPLLERLVGVELARAVIERILQGAPR